MKNFFKERENCIITAIFAIMMIVALSPLISRYCINGHDLDYHLLRIEALKEDILNGQPFAKVNSLFFGGAGYASSMFYADFLLYIPALLRTAGVSINATYHIFVSICAILCCLSVYYCVFKMSGSKYVGLIAGILLTLCPYHMDDMLVRAAVGEYVAFIFVPFVIYGIYNVLYEEMDKPWLFAIGFGGVLLSHTATLLMCVMFCAALFLIKIGVFIKNPKLILKVLLTTVITVAVTAFFWLPMLEQFSTGHFSVVGDGGVDMLDAAVDFSQIVSQKFPTLGIVLALMAILRVFVSKKEEPLLGYADWMIIAAVAFSILTTNIMPWERLSRLFSFVQFPWRFFLIASALLSVADAIIIKAFVAKTKIMWDIVAAVVLVVSMIFALMHQSENEQGYYDYSNDYYSYKPYTANVIGGEWLPDTVTDRGKTLELCEQMIADDGRSIEFTRRGTSLSATLNEEYRYVDVPFIYYKGYSANIQNQDGSISELAVTDEGENGMCRVYSDDKTGSITVSYTGTGIQTVSYIISLLGLATVIFCFVWRRRRSGSEGIETV